ncbi:hypothetical protein [Thalassospira sp.]|uniref:hypothetical protein n=1 Tax=Thalassospira sp. TaxID=1912094 RepID=UPI0027323A41|nr:hypothetical protein [Thalassospira sp.]MDP2697437.1 hypothetical protein [Thalassospira sp.]
MHSDTRTCGHGQGRHGKGCAGHGHGGRGGHGHRNRATETETATETHICRRLLLQNTDAETGAFANPTADAATLDDAPSLMAHGPRRHLHRRLRNGSCCAEARG